MSSEEQALGLRDSSTMVNVHVGFDDTDSPRKGCTTYIAALLVEKLAKRNVAFTDYPNLVRLNPNVPWKTRGNGALCLRIKCSQNLAEKIIEETVSTVEENSDMENAGTDPGIVFFFGEIIPRELENFAKNAMQAIVEIRDTVRLLREYRMDAYGYKKRRGLIGALAAIGATLKEDHTYEIIAYRRPENRGAKRQVDISSIAEMNEKTVPQTFNNIDPETKRVLITPRGPDPILYGVRGETAEAVKKAYRIIHAMEPIERWVIFRTNHGTDMHLKKVNAIKEIQPFKPLIATGEVVQAPRIIPRRHVVFSIADQTRQVDCAAYEPTGELRKIASQLIVGDLIEAYGGVRPASEKNPVTINLEKIRILKIAPKIIYHNPLCPECGKRMKSAGKAKGFCCEKCGFESQKITKVPVEQARNIREGLYVTAPHSQRHLTKPICRYGREKTGLLGKMIKEWHCP